MKNWTTCEADIDLIMQRHYTPGRGGKTVKKIVLHHNAGNLTVEGCYQTWQTREASAHYQVERSGRIGQLVWDNDTAWHAGDFDVNLESIGIEHANEAFAPDWTISAATLENGAHLVAALCHLYKLGRPQWEVNVFPHSDFQATACPGGIAGAQNAAYMTRAQQWFDEMAGSGAPAPTPPAPSAPAGFAVGDRVAPTALVDYNGTRLVSYHDGYTITELTGDRAVLSVGGVVWAALNTGNLRKV